MCVNISLFSDKQGELDNFLSEFYGVPLNIRSSLVWTKKYANPIELADLIGVFIDNIGKFQLSMWINIDKDVYLAVNDSNANTIIKYLFERFPY